MSKFNDFEARYKCLRPWLQIGARHAEAAMLAAQLAVALTARGVVQSDQISQLQRRIDDLASEASLAYTMRDVEQLTNLATAIEQAVAELWSVAQDEYRMTLLFLRDCESGKE